MLNTARILLVSSHPEPYNARVDAIIRNVKDIAADHRHWLESALGRQLTENQQVIIHVVDVGVEPDADARAQALEEAAAIGRCGRANAAVEAVSEEEVDAAIEEAIARVRRRDT
jgi:hypothetical protein